MVLLAQSRHQTDPCYPGIPWRQKTRKHHLFGAIVQYRYGQYGIVHPWSCTGTGTGITGIEHRTCVYTVYPGTVMQILNIIAIQYSTRSRLEYTCTGTHTITSMEIEFTCTYSVCTRVVHVYIPVHVYRYTWTGSMLRTRVQYVPRYNTE